MWLVAVISHVTLSSSVIPRVKFNLFRKLGSHGEGMRGVVLDWFKFDSYNSLPKLRLYFVPLQLVKLERITLMLSVSSLPFRPYSFPSVTWEMLSASFTRTWYWGDMI